MPCANMFISSDAVMLQLIVMLSHLKRGHKDRTYEAEPCCLALYREIDANRMKNHQNEKNVPGGSLRVVPDEFGRRVCALAFLIVTSIGCSVAAAADFTLTGFATVGYAVSDQD